MTTEELASTLRQYLNDNPPPSIDGADEIPGEPSDIGIRCSDGTLLYLEIQAV